MSTPTNQSVGANLYSSGTGTASSNQLVNAVRSPIDPSSSDIRGGSGNYSLGQKWVNYIANNTWTLTSLASSGGIVSAVWTQEGAGTGALNELTGNTGTATPSGGAIAVVGTGDVSTAASGSTVTISINPGTTVISTLTGDSGGAVGPTAGNVDLSGTADQITTTGSPSGSSITFSVPSTFIAPGTIASTTTITSGTSLHATTSMTAGTTITATLGAITATNGNLVLGTVGNKIDIATGSNASIGTSAAMTDGTITISTTAVTASSIIFLTANTLGGTPGTLSAPEGSISAGVHFVITSSSNTDSSTVNWLIIN